MAEPLRLTAVSTPFGHGQVANSGGIAHAGPISGVASGGGLIASAGYDCQVVVADAETGVALDRVQVDHLANHVAVSDCGRMFAVGSSDYTARLFGFDGAHARLMAVLEGHEDDVERIAFCPDDALIATASRDHKVRVFDLDGRLRATLRGHDADVIGLAFIPGRRLVSSSDDGTVAVWDIATGTLVDRYATGTETDAVAVSADGAIYAGTDDGEILRCGAVFGRTVAHRSGVKALAITGSLLLSTSYDRTAALWSIAGGVPELVRRFDIPARVWPRSAAFVGTRRAAFGTFGSRHAMLDLETGAWDLRGVDGYASLNAVRVVEGRVWAVGDSGIVHVDGAPQAELPSLCNFILPWHGRVLTGGQSGALFDAATGEVIVEASWPLNCGTVLPDGTAVIGGYGGQALLVTLGGRHRQVSLHANAIKGLASSAGRMMSVAADGSAHFRPSGDIDAPPAETGTHSRIANGCAALAGGSFASVSRDRCLRLWREGRPAAVLRSPHPHSIKCVAASTDHRFVASGGYRGTVAVYDLAERAWLPTLRVGAAGISSITGAGSRAFLASSYDGLVTRVEVAGPRS